MRKQRGPGRVLALVMGLGAILLANGLLFQALTETRQSVVAQDRAPTLALADSLAAVVGQALAQADARLELARDRAQRADTTTRRMGLRRVLNETLEYAPALTGLAARWEDGRVLAAGKGPLPGIYPRGLDDRDRLIIEGPILIDPGKGTRILRLIRPLSPTPEADGRSAPGSVELRDSQAAGNASSSSSSSSSPSPNSGGSEGGWILADMALDGLKEVFARTMTALPGATATLVLEDGQVLLRLPSQDLPFGYRFPGFPPGGHPVDGAVGDEVLPRADGTPADATLAFRRVPIPPTLDRIPTTEDPSREGPTTKDRETGPEGYPLWVAVSLPREPVLSHWWRGPTPWVLAMAASTLGMLILLAMTLSRINERDRAQAIASQRHALLMTQTRLQRAVLGTVSSPIVVLDGRGAILQANQAFADWVNRPARELKGLAPGDLVPEGVLSILTDPLSSPEGESRELAWPHPDGRTRRVRATARGLASPVREPVGDRAPRRSDRHRSRVVAFLDLTDGVSLAEDLNRAKTTLRTFAQAIATDLRGPLGDMIGRISLLDRRQGETMDPDSRTTLHQALIEGDHMRTLIDDILDYAQIALTAPQRAGVDSNAALERALDALGREIKERAADIRSAMLPPVRCGEAQLASLLRILVGDAIERTPEGQPPKIRVDGSETDGIVTLTVTDSGGGEATPGDSPTPTRPAVAVGLALCGEIVRHAGGTLDYSTARDGTTTRAVTLPAAPPMGRRI